MLLNSKRLCNDNRIQKVNLIWVFIIVCFFLIIIVAAMPHTPLHAMTQSCTATPLLSNIVNRLSSSPTSCMSLSSSLTSFPARCRRRLNLLKHASSILQQTYCSLFSSSRLPAILSIAFLSYACL